MDYYYEKKLAFEFIKRAQQQLLVMLREPQGWTQDLIACNATREPMALHYTVRDADSGKTLAEGTRTAAPDAVTVLDALHFTRSHARFLIINWETPAGPARNHYLSGDPPFDAARYRAWLAKAYP